MSKRQRMDDSEVTSTSGEAGGSGAGTGGSGSDGGGAAAGAPIFSPGRPLKSINSHTKTFTKKFYFKIYANDWIRTINGTTGVTITHFATIIPYQALCMYISPQEYMEIVRGSHYCKVDSSSLELKFKAIRTPFDANSTDAAEANGNLQFEIQRWDGLEHMLPFQIVDLEGRGDGTVTPRTSYAELITRLYGTHAFATQDAAANYKWPATMRERGLSWRPRWSFDARAPNQTTPSAGMYRAINKYISSLPVGEYITDSMNTNVAKMSEGYCFNKTYKPSNGIMSFNSSAVNTSYVDNGRTRINTKIRFTDTITNTAAPVVGTSQYTSLFGGGGGAGGTDTVLDLNGQTCRTISGTPNNLVQAPNAAATANQVFNSTQNPPVKTFLTPPAANQGATGDDYGFGYNNEMQYYTTANLENYTFFNPSRDPPVKHMPSMMIGIVPKTNSDESIVNATAEFECTTSITVTCEDTHPTYMNCAYGGGYDGYPTGYIDTSFTNNILFGGRWQHNEKEVSLRDNKYWTGDYGLAGKPIFREYPGNAPLLE